MLRWTKGRAAWPLAAAGLVLGLAACDDSTGPEGPARVSVFLTDAPGDVASVWIRIEEIHLVGETNTEVELDGDFDGYIEVSELVDETQQLVANEEVELETLHQVRLVLGDAVLVTQQGRVFATAGAELPDEVDAGDEEVGVLHCPSCAQSGIKIVINGPEADLEEGENVSVLLDFDVAQTFGKEAGNSGRWVMRPVVHATLSTVPGDPLSGASITGRVTLATDAGGLPLVTVPQCPVGVLRSLTDFVPTATASTLVDAEGDAIVRTGVVNADGTFTINSVTPDTYAMGLMNVEVGDAVTGMFRLQWTAIPSPATVGIAADDDDEHEVNYLVSSVSCVGL